jgi:hypothetical protein
LMIVSSSLHGENDRVAACWSARIPSLWSHRRCLVGDKPYGHRREIRPHLKRPGNHACDIADANCGMILLESKLFPLCGGRIELLKFWLCFHIRTKGGGYSHVATSN